MLTVLKFRRCYSAYEHSALHAIPSHQSTLASSSALQSPSISLPLDISIETILSVVFICAGLVLGAEELKPISWRLWARKTERESGAGGPFQGLEDRFGVVDIRVCFPCDQMKCHRYTLYAYAVNYRFETRRLISFDSPGKEKRFCGLGTIT